MLNYKNTLEEMVDILISNKQKYTEEFRELPEGTLQYVEDKQRTQFYRAISDVKRKKRMGINKQPELINQLARKEFLRRLLKEMDANINALQYAIGHYRDIDPTAIIRSMTRAYRRLPGELFFRPTEELFASEDECLRARLESHQAWAEQPYEKNSYPFGEYSQYTTRGLHVRSNRELIIAEILYKYKVPFRYDQVVQVGRYKLSPDFSFEMADKRELYMEYCGMMNDLEYVSRFREKRRKYEQAEIYEWDNMIYAFSTGSKVNAAEIEAIIKTRILPRL